MDIQTERAFWACLLTALAIGATAIVWRRCMAVVKRRRMTQHQFLADFSKRSGMSLQEISNMGLRVEKCSCGRTGCQGWEVARRRESGGRVDA